MTPPSRATTRLLPVLLALGPTLLTACGGGGGGGTSDVGATFNHAQGFDDIVACLRTDPSTGALWVGGSFQSYSARHAGGIFRFGPSGAIDESFASGAGFDESVSAVLPLGNGRTYVVGDFSSYDGAPAPGIARLLDDGTLDPTFDPGTGFGLGSVPGSPTALALADDGSQDLWVAGFFDTYDGAPAPTLARIASDGGLVGGASTVGFDSTVFALESAGDGTGDVIAGGDFTSYDGAAAPGLVRIDGVTRAKDPSLAVGAGFRRGAGAGRVFALARAVDGSGALYVGGFFDTYDGAAVAHLVRLAPGGARDPGFAAAPTNLVAGIAPALDGSEDVWICGVFGPGSVNGVPFDAPNGIARLNPDGTVDASFDPLGEAFAGSSANAVAVAGDGSGDVTVGGFSSLFGGQGFSGLVRLDPDGGVDATSLASGAISGLVYDVLPIPGSRGEVYVCGTLESIDGQPSGDILHLASDGTLLESFGRCNGVCSELALDLENERLYAAGTFLSYDAFSQNSVVRLDLQGVADAGFFVGPWPFSGPDQAIRRIGLIPGGGLLVNGPYSTWDGAQARNLMALRADGVPLVRNSFPDGAVGDFVQARDGSERVWVGGSFTVHALPAPRIALLLPVTGVSSFTVDPSFDPGTGFDSTVNALAPAGAGSGAVYCGGVFNSYDGVPVHGVARVLPDGSLDPSFDTGDGFFGNVDVLGADDQGYLYVSGRFVTFDGQPVPDFVRLRPDGSLDASFEVGTSFNGPVRRIVPVGDGSRELYVCGIFSSYNGVFTGSVVRLNFDGSLD